MMNSKVYALIFSLFVLFSATNAFNITRILTKHSDFSTFNGLLTQTGLAERINTRSTITVLVLEDDALRPLQGKSKVVVRHILSNHVILDYYDIQRFKKLPNKTATLTTLFQSSGSAEPGQGFLNITISSSGDVLFGSGVKASNLTSKAVKSVYSQPYNISVIQISEPIVAPGIDAAPPESEPSEAPRKAPVPSPSSDDGDEPAEAPSDDKNVAPEPAGSGGESNSPPPPESDAESASGKEAASAVGVLMTLVLSFMGF